MRKVLNGAAFPAVVFLRALFLPERRDDANLSQDHLQREIHPGVAGSRSSIVAMRLSNAGVLPRTSRGSVR